MAKRKKGGGLGKEVEDFVSAFEKGWKMATPDHRQKYYKALRDKLAKEEAILKGYRDNPEAARRRPGPDPEAVNRGGPRRPPSPGALSNPALKNTLQTDADATAAGEGYDREAAGGAPKKASRASPELQAMFENAERKYGLPAGYLERTATVESTMNPNAKNKNSTAGGLFQFIDKTSERYGMGGKGDRRRYDPELATDAAARLAVDNQKALRKVLGRDPTAGELYLAHQQGAGGAAKLLRNPNGRVGDTLPADHIRLNGGNPNMTNAEFAGKWTGKYKDVDARNAGGTTGESPRARGAGEPSYTPPSRATTETPAETTWRDPPKRGEPEGRAAAPRPEPAAAPASRVPEPTDRAQTNRYAYEPGDQNARLRAMVDNPNTPASQRAWAQAEIAKLDPKVNESASRTRPADPAPVAPSANSAARATPAEAGALPVDAPLPPRRPEPTVRPTPVTREVRSDPARVRTPTAIPNDPADQGREGIRPGPGQSLHQPDPEVRQWADPPSRTPPDGSYPHTPGGRPMTMPPETFRDPQIGPSAGVDPRGALPEATIQNASYNPSEGPSVGDDWDAERDMEGLGDEDYAYADEDPAYNAEYGGYEGDYWDNMTDMDFEMDVGIGGMGEWAASGGVIGSSNYAGGYKGGSGGGWGGAPAMTMAGPMDAGGVDTRIRNRRGGSIGSLKTADPTGFSRELGYERSPMQTIYPSTMAGGLPMTRLANDAAPQRWGGIPETDESKVSKFRRLREEREAQRNRASEGQLGARSAYLEPDGGLPNSPYQRQVLDEEGYLRDPRQQWEWGQTGGDMGDKTDTWGWQSQGYYKGLEPGRAPGDVSTPAGGRAWGAHDIPGQTIGSFNPRTGRPYGEVADTGSYARGGLVQSFADGGGVLPTAPNAATQVQGGYGDRFRAMRANRSQPAQRGATAPQQSQYTADSYYYGDNPNIPQGVSWSSWASGQTAGDAAARLNGSEGWYDGQKTGKYENVPAIPDTIGRAEQMRTLRQYRQDTKATGPVTWQDAWRHQNPGTWVEDPNSRGKLWRNEDHGIMPQADIIAWNQKAAAGQAPPDMEGGRGYGGSSQRSDKGGQTRSTDVWSGGGNSGAGGPTRSTDVWAPQNTNDFETHWGSFWGDS